MRELPYYAHKCPVCGKYEFPEYDTCDFCPVCGWGDDPYQIYFPDETGFNPVSLEEARESYKATGDSYAFYCDRNNLPRDEEYIKPLYSIKHTTITLQKSSL